MPMPMNDEASATRAALTRLLLRSRGPRDTRSVVRNATRGRLQVLGDGDLKTEFIAHFPKVRIPPSNHPETVFPLPRFNHGPNFIPFLSFSWDFGPANGQVPRYFRLYMVPTGTGVHPVRDGRPTISILRFEPQETNALWSFSHVQQCDKEDVYTDWCGLDPELVSPEIPRIPLVGVQLDAPGLLLALITSLYGVGSTEFSLVANPDVLRASDSASYLVRQLTPMNGHTPVDRERGDGRHR